MNYMIFGESHGPAIGVTISGIPSGLEIDFEEISRELSRRATGKNALSTARKEKDEIKILSGLFEGKTCGTPLCAIIENVDTRSKDYQNDLPRPGHADYAAHLRYEGHNDYRGGGHFSARLTAPLVFAGALAKQILAQRGVYIGAHIASVYGIEDTIVDNTNPESAALRAVAKKEFPTISDSAGERMRAAILAAREQGDSVGGSIECFALGIPAGLGCPDFGLNVEGIISKHIFAVPAVKAIAFGAGFRFAQMRGSEANDAFFWEDDVVKTRTNNSGGINGGITNGMPICFTVAMRPTPSISRPQETISIKGKTAAILEIHGRHDPCVVHRAVPVIEAASALAICEILGV